MIVTRRRKKSFPWKRLGLPLLVIAFVIAAFAIEPSRNAIMNGPLAPMWRTADAKFAPITAPFHFAAQNQVITERNRQILQLQQQVADAQGKAQEKDKQITALQNHVSQLESKPEKTPAPATLPQTKPNGGFSAPSSSDLSASATADMRRTAQDWASMDPENAAKLVEKLPTAYVARVFAVMTPDAAGAVLDALPPVYAAQLTQEHPELRK